MSERVTYLRLYADAAGESHFGEVAADLERVAFTPPAPALWVSAGVPAESYRFLRPTGAARCG